MCLPHAASEGTTSVTEAAHIGAVGHEEPAMSDEDRPNDRRPERGNGVRGHRTRETVESCERNRAAKVRQCRQHPFLCTI